MKIAVISDIHGNYDAFVAVLNDIERVGVDQIYCLGDFVDYGPESERVSALLRERQIPTVLGNHENALFDDNVLAEFGQLAYESMLITKRLVSSETIAYTQQLPLYLCLGNMRFVHGAPPDSPHKYVFYLTAKELLEAFQSTPQSIIFVGHTHLTGIFEYDGQKLYASQLPRGICQLRPDWRYVINAGSVGQPREINKQAKYVVFDDQSYQLETRYVTYDPHRTISLIYELGLPAECGARLVN